MYIYMPNFENNFLPKEEKKLELSQENAEDREGRQEANEQEIVWEKEKLKTFVDVMGNMEYYMGGGLAAELIEENLKYRHKDIDIIIFEDQEEKIVDRLKDHGFDVRKKPKFAGHDLDAMNFDVDEEGDEAFQDASHGLGLYIGIFVYARNEERGTAQQMEEDGAINKEFPLSYFNKENQTLDYEGDKFTVADLRLVASLKLISNRPKDLKDVENMLPFLKAKFSEEEIEELKNVSKENMETRSRVSLQHMFEEFLKTDREVNAENIFEYFSSILRLSIDRIKDEGYAAVARTFLEYVRGFAPSSNDPEIIKKEFQVFVLKGYESITEYQNKIIDRVFG